MIRGGKVRPHNRKWNMGAGSKKKLPTRPPSNHPREPQPHQAPCIPQHVHARVRSTAGKGPQDRGRGPRDRVARHGGHQPPNEKTPKTKKRKAPRQQQRLATRGETNTGQRCRGEPIIAPIQNAHSYAMHGCFKRERRLQHPGHGLGTRAWLTQTPDKGEGASGVPC